MPKRDKWKQQLPCHQYGTRAKLSSLIIRKISIFSLISMFLLVINVSCFLQCAVMCIRFHLSVLNYGIWLQMIVKFDHSIHKFCEKVRTSTQGFYNIYIYILHVRNLNECSNSDFLFDIPSLWFNVCNTFFWSYSVNEWLTFQKLFLMRCIVSKPKFHLQLKNFNQRPQIHFIKYFLHVFLSGSTSRVKHFRNTSWILTCKEQSGPLHTILWFVFLLRDAFYVTWKSLFPKGSIVSG